ncbi:MAG: Crp/Fnr family transcriptional regulator [Nitrospirota bacterium]|jgi:hypothetical protein
MAAMFLPPTSPLDLLLRQLTAEQRRTVIDFARFLVEENKRRGVEPGGRDDPAAASEPDASEPATQPLAIPRPPEEKPVHALKRLKANYPMLTGESLFSEAANLMMRHHMMGHDGGEVIDEMEALFAAAYEKWQAERE